MAHTPGPWAARQLGTMAAIGKVDEAGDFIGILAYTLPTDGDEYLPPLGGSEFENAVVMAASPDLLAALQLVNEWAHTLPDDSHPEDGVDALDALERVENFLADVWPVVDAALAKADRGYVA